MAAVESQKRSEREGEDYQEGRRRGGHHSEGVGAGGERS